MGCKLYIIEGIAKKSSKRMFYIGITNNIDSRLSQHRSGKSKFTKRFEKITLVFLKTFRNKGEAMKYEKQIKKFNKERKLVLINSKSNELRFDY